MKYRQLRLAAAGAAAFLICSLAPGMVMAEDVTMPDLSSGFPAMDLSGMQQISMDPADFGSQLNTGFDWSSLEGSGITPELNAPSMQLGGMTMEGFADQSGFSGFSGISGLSQGDMSLLMDQFVSQALGGNSMNFSDTFNSMSQGMQIDTSKLYDSVNAAADYGFVNMQFDMLQQNMQGFASSYDAQIKNSSAADIFHSTFGNPIKELDTSQYSIPEGYSPASMLAEVSQNYFDQYAGNQQIQAVVGSVNISDVFAASKTTLAMPDLVGYGALSDMMAEPYSSMFETAMSDYTNNADAVNQAYDHSEIYNSIATLAQNQKEIKTTSKNIYDTNVANYYSDDSVGDKIDHMYDQNTYWNQDQEDIW